MNDKEQKRQNNAAGEEPRKELTEQQIQQRRKMVVFPLMLLAFAGVMWLIFAPGPKTEQEQQSGLNTDLPTPEAGGIVADKRDAYRQEALEAKRQEKMRSLEDFAFSLGEETETEEERLQREERELRMSPKPAEYHQNPSRFDGTGSALHSSVGAYRDLNRQLGSFYERTEAEPDEKESELQRRIEQLEAQLEDEKTRQDAEAGQLALIEKSYQMAARYMNGGQGVDENPAQTVPAAVTGKKITVQPVGRVQHNVVTLLAAPMSDSVVIAELAKPRNWGFNTAAGDERLTPKNSISACIYRTMVVTDGKEVPLRLTEPMTTGGVLIPANTVLTGTARIDGQRMTITVNAVQHEGNVIPVELAVYDMDGGEGICVPSSDEINAVKEIAANAGSGLGSSITITDDAGTQLLSDLGRSVIQGTAQYVGQKIRQVKVTLKAGYRVLLLPPLD